VLAVLAALAHRDRTGAGQFIDLSMQDITAWLTQTAWNTHQPCRSPVRVIACRDGHVVAEGEMQDLQSLADLPRREAVARLAGRGVTAAPVLTVHEMLAGPQTAARRLWFPVSDDGETWPLLASPLRLTATPTAVREPMPALGRDTTAILEALQSAESRS
jgi:crotonobetainyl-CoA:carnitine CoA-transferase CaiB-like acyl-CoA transferase